MSSLGAVHGQWGGSRSSKLEDTECQRADRWHSQMGPTFQYGGEREFRCDIMTNLNRF